MRAHFTGYSALFPLGQNSRSKHREHSMKIGLIGLGITGRPMALNLLKGGHDVSQHAITEGLQTIL